MDLNTDRNFRITKFLIELNTKMDGIYVEETTEYDHPRPTIKFDASLTCMYANKGMWSPNDAFYDVLLNAAKKHFEKFESLHDFNWNNTHTVFWIDKEKVHAEI